MHEPSMKPIESESPQSSPTHTNPAPLQPASSAHTPPITKDSVLSEGLQALGEYLIGVCNQHKLVAYETNPDLPGGAPMPVMWSPAASKMLGIAVVKILRDTTVVKDKRIEHMLRHLGDVRRQVQLYQEQETIIHESKPNLKIR